MAFTLVPTLLIGILLSIAFVINKKEKLDTYLREWGYGLIEPLAISTEYSLTFQDYGPTQELLNLYHCRYSDKIRAIAIYDEHNEFVMSSHAKISPYLQVDDSSVSLEEPSEHCTEDTIIVRMPIASTSAMAGSLRKMEGKSSRKLGYIAVALDRTAGKYDYYKTSGLVVFFLVLHALVGVICGMKVTEEVVPSMGSIVRWLDHMRKGEPHVALQDPASREMEAVQRGMENLASYLQTYRIAMQEHLEQSTKELEETLEQMEIQNVELNLAKNKAQEAMQAKSEFLANMSHELRTPLNSIVGFTRQLVKTPLSPNQLDALQTIERSGQTLLSIVNDLLDFSKLEAGKLVLEAIPFSLRDCLDEVVTLLATSAHTKGLELVLWIDATVEDHLVGDPLRLQQVLTNLVANAIKFTHLGSISIRVTQWSIGSDRVKIHIVVADSGVGIGADQKKGLFEAFQQADNSITRQYGGTGLGLVITKRLIAQMEGSIGFQSNENKGSSFWFSAMFTVPALPRRVASHLDMLENKRLLCVESNDIARHGLQQLLKKEPLSVMFTASIPEGIEQGFDFVLFSRPTTKLPLDWTAFRKELAALQSIAEHVLIALPTHHLALAIGVMDQLAEVTLLAKPVVRSQFFSVLCSKKRREPFVEARFEERCAQRFPMRVMVVDDTEPNNKLMQALLQNRVEQLVVCSSGYEAIEKAKEIRFDLLLMDMQMPGIDGLDTTKAIRRDSKNQGTPVVVMTAYPLEESELIQSGGFCEVLEKPIDERQLEKILQKYVEQRKASCISLVKEVSFQESPPILQEALPAINWRLACQLAGSRPALAKDLLQMLVESFAPVREEVHGFLQGKTDQGEAIRVIHKLHGSSCYSGVPQLQALCRTLETSLRKGISVENLRAGWCALLTEMDRIEAAAKALFPEADKKIPALLFEEQEGLESS